MSYTKVKIRNLHRRKPLTLDSFNQRSLASIMLDKSGKKTCLCCPPGDINSEMKSPSYSNEDVNTERSLKERFIIIAFLQNRADLYRLMFLNVSTQRVKREIFIYHRLTKLQCQSKQCIEVL